MGNMTVLRIAFSLQNYKLYLEILTLPIMFIGFCVPQVDYEVNICTGKLETLDRCVVSIFNRSRTSTTSCRCSFYCRTLNSAMDSKDHSAGYRAS
ncbi:hypothetical protein ACSBR2_038492 [Camellia fascicularis]